MTINKSLFTGVIADNIHVSVAASAPPPSFDQGTLQSVIPECVFDLDCTIVSSYGGTSAVWKNLVANPFKSDVYADCSQNAWNFTIGSGTPSETSDPTYTSASANKASSYFLMDGGDVFGPANRGVDLPAVVSNWMNGTSAFTFLVVVYDAVGVTSPQQCFWGNNRTANTKNYFLWDVVNNNARFIYDTSVQRVYTFSNVWGSTEDMNSYITVFAAQDNNTAQAYWRNNGRVTASVCVTIAGSADAHLVSGSWWFGTRGSAASGVLRNGQRIVTIAGFYKYLTSADISAVNRKLGNRHGRLYP